MATSLEDIPGLDAELTRKLRDAGIRTPDALINAGRTPQGRQQLGCSLGTPPERVRQWVEAAELFGVRGIGGRYGRLLVAVQIGSVAALRAQSGRELAARMSERNAELGLCRNTPDPLTVTLWIEQAKQIQSRIEL